MTRGPVKRLKLVAKSADTADIVVPKHIPLIARDIYRDAAKVLADQGRLNAGNIQALESYCAEIASARRAENALKKQGSYFIDKSGRPTAHPAVKIASAARQQARMLAGRLGLIQESRDAGRAGGADYVSREDDEFEGDDI